MLFEQRKKSLMVTIAIVTLVVTVVPAVITSDNFFAFAHSCDNDDHDYDDESEENGNSNEADQGISQEQSSVQNSQVVSGEDTIVSGNNVGLFFNDNIGNLALGQQ